MNTHRERGFTLLELLVSLSLIGVTFFAAQDIFNYALRLHATSGASLRDSSPADALRFLRNDVHTAARLPGDAAGWRRSPMVLERADGTTVTWKLEHGWLIRTESPTDASAEIRRRLVGEMQSWQWRIPAPDLVEVSAVMRSHGDPVVAASSAAFTAGEHTEQTTLDLRFTRRVRSGGQAW